MTYTRMDQISAADAIHDQLLEPPNLVDAVVGQLELLKEEDQGSAAVNRYIHSLQTATRALRDGADDETVVCALLHDMGDTLSPHNHAEFAAEVLRPYVGDENYWVVKHHDIFQGYYYFHHVGMDRKLRDAYRSSPHFKACVRFCERWDQRSFDPAYPTEPLDRFIPMVREIFGRQPKDMRFVRS